jgi:transposase InsO family protein/transposase-like protein
MPFKTKTVRMQRIEFVSLALKPASNISLLCKRFGITRKTGYKWLKRYQAGGIENLTDASKRPKRFPNRTSEAIENHVIKERNINPEWGSKKIHRILVNKRTEGTYPFDHIPCKNTITSILKREGLIKNESSENAKHWERFEHENPNELWQMDFKGYFILEDRTQCHPLTILDDHSRYNIGLFACKNETYLTVKEKLVIVFRKYGLPGRILADNGNPWGATFHKTSDDTRAFTQLEKWMISLNIGVVHGKPYHPQTQGKEERFHRTLKTELLQYEQFSNIQHCQKRFDWWREKYNCLRPHEAIDLKTPSNLYRPSCKSYSDIIKPPEYDLSDKKRKVDEKGFISFNGTAFRIGKAFHGVTVAVKPTLKDGTFNVYFYNQIIRTLNLTI